MGYFDGLTESTFKKNANGDFLFYPWGSLGNGFLINTEENYKEIYKRIKLFNILALPISMCSYFFGGLIISLVVGSIFFLFYYSYTKNVTSNLSQVDEKLLLIENYQAFAKSQSFVSLTVLTTLSLFFVIAGVNLIYMRSSIVAGIAGCVFFTPSFLSFLYMIVFKIRGK